MSASRGYRLDWKGRDIIAASIPAMKTGADQTMARCVVSAKQLVRKKTTTLQGSIRFEPSKVSGKGVHGVWGSFDVNYALWQEIGTTRMAAKPYLRPSADFEYGLLEKRIRAAMEAIL